MQRYAILIGCNKAYDPQLQALSEAEADADRVLEMLRRHNSWEDANIHRLVGDVYPSQIDRLIESLCAELHTDDFVFIYYAGHAGHLRTGNSSENQYELFLPSAGYPLKRLLDAFITTERPISALMALDACFSEHATVSMFRKFLDNLALHFTSKSKPDAELAERSESIPRSRLVLAASATKAREREGIGGYFTIAFRQAAEFGGDNLAAAKNGVVDSASLGTYLDQVLKRQIPKQAIYGDTLTIKTALEWRVKQGAPLITSPSAFLMLEEVTRLWYSSPNKSTNLISAYWSGEPLTIALGYQGQPVELWRLKSGDSRFGKFAELPTLPARRGLKVSPGGDYIAIASAEGKVVIFPISETMAAVPKITHEFAVTPEQFVLTSQNHLVTLAQDTQVIQVWAVDRPAKYNDPIATNQPPGSAEQADTPSKHHMRALPDGSAFVTGSTRSGEALKWDLSALTTNAKLSKNPLALTPEVIRVENKSYPQPFGEAVRIAISPNGEYIAVGFGGSPGRVRIWRADQLHEPILGISYPEHDQMISALEFSPDSRLLASGCLSGEVYLTTVQPNIPPQQLLNTKQSGGWITALTFSTESQGGALAVGTRNGRVLICALDAYGRSQELAGSPERGNVYRIIILSQETHPSQVLVATQRGLECWDLVR